MDEAADAEVIAASFDDPTRFAVIFDRHAGTVFRFLVRRVGRATADELLGETFRVAFERRAAFDLDRSSAGPWLYGIATNLMARHRRVEARRLRATARLAPGPSPPALADRVVAAVDAQAVWPDVLHAIAGLPDGERDALLLYVWEELSYEEIAVALQVPVGTVRSRLNRARGHLRERVPSGEGGSATRTRAQNRTTT